MTTEVLTKNVVSRDAVAGAMNRVIQIVNLHPASGTLAQAAATHMQIVKDLDVLTKVVNEWLTKNPIDKPAATPAPASP